MKRLIQKITFFFEVQSYGVCGWIARKIGISTYKVRLGFIYLSFLTFGSPVLLYLVLAWILEHKHYFKFQAERKKSIWDL